MFIRYIHFAGFTLFCLLAAACATQTADSARTLTQVTGRLPDLEFSLTDDEGHSVTAQNYRGKTVVLYFGFSECPTECPLTLARLAGILRQMGKDADSIRIVFVSIDPAHDTPQTLRRYLETYHTPQMHGLTGSEDALRALANRYQATLSSKASVISHSTLMYVFDASGRARLIATEEDSDEIIKTALQHLSL